MVTAHRGVASASSFFALLALVLSHCTAWASTPLAVNSYEEERLAVQGCLASSVTSDVVLMENEVYAGELIDDFDTFRDDIWEEWRDGRCRTGEVKRATGTLQLSMPEHSVWCCLGIRSRERLVSVPIAQGRTFYIRLDLNTRESRSGALMLTPRAYDDSYRRPQIRLLYQWDEKMGEFTLGTDTEDKGSMRVPLVPHYGAGLLIDSRQVMLLERSGKVLVKADLPSWAAPGTTLYLSLCAMAGPQVGPGSLTINSIRVRHPLTLRRDTCLAWSLTGTSALEEQFQTIDEKVWTPWAAGGASPARVTTTADGLRFAVEEGLRWGQFGVFSVDPIVERPCEAGGFCSVEMTVDTTFTSGARIALVTSPRDTIWGTPHVRVGLEQRGLVCESWLGDETAIAGSFHLPRLDHCLVTLLLGHFGLYAIGPDCRLEASAPMPAWAEGHSRFYLALHSQSPRPNKPCALGIRSVFVTNHQRLPHVESTASTVPSTEVTSALTTLVLTGTFPEVMASPSTSVTSATTGP